MRDGLRKLVGLALCLFMAGSLAYAQGSGSSSLSGLVVDSGGGVIPGATVVVKNNATSVSQTVVTNSSGAWPCRALPTGVYTVTVSLSGFKTVVINDVRLLAGTANEVKAKLEVGQLTESIDVTGRHRARPDAVCHGAVESEGRAAAGAPARVAQHALCRHVPPRRRIDRGRRPARASTINGLPQNTMNITIDGITHGQPAAVGRRVLLDGHAASGRGRGNHGDRRRAGRRGSQGSMQVEFVTRSGEQPVDEQHLPATCAVRSSTRTTTSTR